MITQLVVSHALALSAAQIPAEAAKGYAEVLSMHVANGRVDYKGLENKSLAKLDAYVAAVAKAKLPAKRAARIAFWVDAYNGLVLRAVIGAGRPRSVLDVKGFFDAKKHVVAGKSVTLNDLEKKVLNPYAKDPRTHMVLVCAAVGCPILESKPYAGSDIDKRFAAATRRYLAGRTGAVPGTGSVQLSKIFDWYKADFGGPDGVVAFVKKHLPAKKAEALGKAPKVSFLEYNWTLNQQ